MKDDDWTPNNPKWWTKQSPLVATYAAQGYYLLQMLKWGFIFTVILGPVGYAIYLILNSF